MSEPGSAIGPVAASVYGYPGLPSGTLTVGQVIRRLFRWGTTLPVVFKGEGEAYGIQGLDLVPMRRELTDAGDTLGSDVYSDVEDVPALCDCYEEPSPVVLLHAGVAQRTWEVCGG